MANKGKFVYMNTEPGGNKFKFRGRAKPGDNPESFRDKMYAKGGHCVVLSDEYLEADEVAIPAGFPAPTPEHIALHKRTWGAKKSGFKKANVGGVA